MALLYSYGTGGSASADRYSTVDELLTQIPDNTANLIVAQDIRDSVFTLWERIDDVSLIAGSAASASAFFQNPDPTTVNVGGIIAGTSFPTPQTMQEMWDLLLYPYVPPVANLTSGTTQKRYGDSLSLTLNWSATKNSNDLISIVVNGISQPGAPFITSQSGSQGATGTHSLTPGSSETNTFTMTVNDGTTSINNSHNVTWRNDIYWGTVDLSSIGNPNLTTNPGSASLVGSVCTDSVIKTAGGGGVGTGKELSSTKSKTYTGIDGGGDYLIFAWPSNVAGALSPSFTVNGLPSTAFTRVRTNSNLSNDSGFIDEYEVWISNTLQNSPLNIVIS